MSMTAVQEAIDNLAKAARQLGQALCDTFNALAQHVRQTVAECGLSESWAALFEYPKVLAQATPKELHYIHNAKKARTRKKYYNRVKRRIKKDGGRA